MDSRKFLFINPSPLQPALQDRQAPRARPALVFSPPKQVRAKKDGQENEQPPVMLLMQFQPKEYLNFKQIEVGSSKTMQVRLKNPSCNCQDVDFRKFPSIDKGFRVEDRHLSVLPQEEVTLNVIWEPTQPLKISESIYMSTSDGHHLQVVLIGTAVKTMPKPAKRGPNRKATLAKGKTFQVLPRTTSMQLQQKKRNEAAVLIQKTWRGYWTRKLILQQIYEDRMHCIREESATTIQRFWRGYWTRRQFKQLKTRRNFAATKIQRCYRGYLVKKHTEAANKAAIAIQRVWRGYWIRQNVYEKLKEDRMNRLREVSATTIQRFWRGYWTRKQLKELNHRQTLAAIKIQRFYRSYLVKKETKAAIIIQKLWRGYLARKQVQRLLDQRRRRILAAITIQRFYRNYVLRKQTKAATTIQRTWRAYWTRKQVRKLVDRRRHRNFAAIKIQRCYRGYLVKKHTEAANKAAIAIQRVWRGYWIRKNVYAKLKEDRINCLRENSATSIQRFWRGYWTRRQFEQLKTRRNFAAIKIQRCYRGYLVKKQFEADTKAAIAIQRVWRGHWIRKNVYVKLKEDRLRKVSATTIQRVWRGYWTRKQLKELNDRRALAAIKIQRFYRSYLAEKQAKSATKAAITIQKVWRGYWTRKQLKQLNDQFQCRTLAAIKIQRFYRSYLVQREIKAANRAAIVIQKVWRGYWTRKNVYAKLKEIEMVRRRVSLLGCNEEQRLGNRTSVALQAILTYNTLDKMSHHLSSLIATTRMSPESCVTIAQASAVKVLLALIAKVNRGIHSQELICMIFDILINLAKYSNTWSEVALAQNVISTVLNQVKRNWTNEKVTCKGLTLLYIIFNRAPDDKLLPKFDLTSKKLVKDIFDTLEREISRKATTKPVKKPTKRAPAFNPYWAAKAGVASEFKNKFDAYFYLNGILKAPK